MDALHKLFTYLLSSVTRTRKGVSHSSVNGHSELGPVTNRPLIVFVTPYLTNFLCLAKGLIDALHELFTCLLIMTQKIFIIAHSSTNPNQ